MGHRAKNDITWRACVLASLLGCFLSIAGTQSWAADGTARLYPFETATLHYKLSGMQTGSQTVYIRDWGAMQAQYVDSSISMMGYSRPFKMVTVSDPDWVYTADLTSSRGARIANPLRPVYASGERDVRAVGDKMLTAMGGTKSGTDMFEGQACTIWEMASVSTKMCFRADNVLVYTRTEMMGQVMEITLVDVKEGEVDDSKFTPPDIPYSDGTAAAFGP